MFDEIEDIDRAISKLRDREADLFIQLDKERKRSMSSKDPLEEKMSREMKLQMDAAAIIYAISGYEESKRYILKHRTIRRWIYFIVSLSIFGLYLIFKVL